MAKCSLVFICRNGYSRALENSEGLFYLLVLGLSECELKFRLELWASFIFHVSFMSG